MRIDLHTHTLMSDGVLLPIELARRAVVMGHEAIAITDHVSLSNVERVLAEVGRDCELAQEWGIDVILGCEITHVPAKKLDVVVNMARKCGAEFIVVHGETISEPVEKGTNRAAVNNPEVDMLAHPGFITSEEAQAAVDNGVILELTSRASHSPTNGHVVRMARKVDAKMVVNTDAHRPEDLIDEETAMRRAMGAGLTQDEAEIAVRKIPKEVVRRIRNK